MYMILLYDFLVFKDTPNYKANGIRKSKFLVYSLCYYRRLAIETFNTLNNPKWNSTLLLYKGSPSLTRYILARPTKKHFSKFIGQYILTCPLYFTDNRGKSRFWRRKKGSLRGKIVILL